MHAIRYYRPNGNLFSPSPRQPLVFRANPHPLTLGNVKAVCTDLSNSQTLMGYLKRRLATIAVQTF